MHQARCHAEPVEACGRRPLRAPYDRLKVTPRFIYLEISIFTFFPLIFSLLISSTVCSMRLRFTAA